MEDIIANALYSFAGQIDYDILYDEEKDNWRLLIRDTTERIVTGLLESGFVNINGKQKN